MTVRERWFDAARVSWDQHSDLIRTALQETGQLRLTFLRLTDLTAAVYDLGIDPASVFFRDGYAVIDRAANSHSEPSS